MRKTIYIYVGLPGSGKTYCAKNDMQKIGGVLFDDKYQVDELVSAIKNPIIQNIFIADPNFIFTKIRNKFIEFLKEFDIYPVWYFFENTPAKALANIKYRNDRKLISGAALKNYFSKHYEVPLNTKTISIWQSE